jgi:hypothetical protein
MLNTSQRNETAVVLAKEISRKEVSRKVQVKADHVSILRFLLAAKCP